VSRTSTGSSSRRNRVVPYVPGTVPESPEQVRATLLGLGITPSRELGQSFLVDPFVADAEAALTVAPPAGPIVEIGGGLGILTQALLRRGVTALTVIEKDRRLARHLRAAFGDRVTVREGDALEAELPEWATVVGNLPFSTATPIFLRLLARRVPRVVVMVQKEVAARLGAGPGSRTYGRLTIAAALYGRVELFQEVPERAFYPPPAVRAQIVVHTAREGPLPVASVERFESVVRALFSSRRKQLGNLLPRLTGGEPQSRRLAEAAGWPADWSRRRPEELAPEAFFRLSDALT
jgi:16S rRNA (adenine1518-N6/adenine1519-N6)-dimethyltransferase